MMRAHSYIDIQNQILGTAVAIVGTSFTLHYSSDRVRGRCAAYELEIPLSEKNVPPGLKEIRLEVYLAGQSFTKTFPATSQQSYTFAWDGNDGSGKPVSGTQKAKIRIGYLYKALFPYPAMTRWTESTASVGTCGSVLGLTGWNLDVNHCYDFAGRVLYLGDGARRSDINVDPAKIPGRENGADEIVIAAEDGSELYVFDFAGRHIRTVHAFTAEVLYQFAYDLAGRLITIQDGDENITRIEHPTITSSEIIGPYGQRTTLKQNSDSSLTSITNASGENVQLTYSKDGLLEVLIDPNGNSYSFIYDRSGRLVQRKDPTGAVTGLAGKRDDRGSLIAMISPSGRESTYLVERLSTREERRVNKCCGGSEVIETRRGNTRAVTFSDGTVVQSIEQPDPRFGMQAPVSKELIVISPGGLKSNMTIDRILNLSDPKNGDTLNSISETLSINGRAYRSVYEIAIRRCTKTSPAGRVSTTTIDAVGRIRQVQIADFLPINIEYDAAGRCVSLEQGSGPTARKITLSYTNKGRLDTISDDLGSRLNFAYDLAGQLVGQILPDGGTISFTHDANGNLTSVTPPGRSPHKFSYTATNLLTAHAQPDEYGSNETQYRYNHDRQLELITWPDSMSVQLRYDSSGRLCRIDYSDGQVIYEYDRLTGNLITSTAPGGVKVSYTYDGSLLIDTQWNGTVRGKVSRVYDHDFRIKSVGINGISVSFEYDDDGLIIGAGSLGFTRNAQNGLVVATVLDRVTDHRSYNGFGELIRYTASFTDTVLLDIHYIRDKLGRITEKTETIGGITANYSYKYDGGGRLAEVKKAGATTAVYSYDKNGNRLSGPGLQAQPTYDARDRLLHCREAKYSYTANGELQSETTDVGITTYTYDGLGNLVRVKLSDDQEIEYVVDGNGYRVGKKIDHKSVQGFLYEERLRPIAELDGNNNIVAQFIYGTRFNVPDYMVKNGTMYRIISDDLGSPRLVVDANTGRVGQRMDFDEFGNVVNDTNPGFQPFGFAGGRYDQHTKLTRFGARDYHAETGRWTSQDRIGFQGGDANLYTYAFNDPINRIDPLGYKTLMDWLWDQVKFDPGSVADDLTKHFGSYASLVAARELLRAQRKSVQEDMSRVQSYLRANINSGQSRKSFVNMGLTCLIKSNLLQDEFLRQRIDNLTDKIVQMEQDENYTVRTDPSHEQPYRLLWKDLFEESKTHPVSRRK